MAESILVIGYGNPGRLDDGLGPAAIACMEKLDLQGVVLDSDYQIRIEDAAELAAYDALIFIDAASSGPEPFGFERIEADPERRFSTHSVSPGALLQVAKTCFGTEIPAWMLAIRGYEFDEFGERISERARANLDAAVAFLLETLEARRQGGNDKAGTTAMGAHHA